MALWWAARSALYLAWLVLSVLPCAALILLLSLAVRGAPLYAVARLWLRLAIAGARVICGVRFRVHGLQHLPGAGAPRRALVLAAKHQGAWEAFALPVMMPHPVAYVFKRELLWWPFFGWAMGRLDMIPIDRRRHADAWSRIATRGRELAARGIWVTFFPEGTRVARGRRGRYSDGAARLAIECGLPVVPVAATSGRCWPARSLLLRPGTVDVSIGAPIASDGRRRRELMAEVETWIEAEMRRLDPQAYADG